MEGFFSNIAFEQSSPLIFSKLKGSFWICWREFFRSEWD